MLPEILKLTISGLFLVVTLASCGRTATEPEDCTSSVIFQGESFYLQRTEPEQQFEGTLEFRNSGSVPPNQRDHHFFLNGTPVYSGGFPTAPTFPNAVRPP